MSRPVLQPKNNVWRTAHSGRASVLVDAGRYFGAVREAMLKAQSTIFILGWDLDSRTRLVGESGKADDGHPEGLVDFLSALVEKRRALTVHVLVWDFSVLYAMERELFPSFALRWRTPRRVRYCLDDDLPFGASHHQKIVVVDDAVAFCGGLDLTIRRWDTRAHNLNDPCRIDAVGAHYPPFHDVQAMVDGEAAQALGALARTRWTLGACDRPPPLEPVGDPWPDSFKPDLTDINVGIARTLPATEDMPEVREVETLFYDMVDRAERMIYIENQYLTARHFAERLAKRMQERPRLEAVFVAPKFSHSWLEQQAMQSGLARFMQVFEQAGLQNRARLLYPDVCHGGRSIDTMVHSKVMIVDDTLLRVGSANLNNRSLGLDTECDLAFEAATDDHRKSIGRLRDCMLGHFCGVDEAKVAETIARTGSLVETARTLSQNGHSLQPIELDYAAATSPLEGVGDPERPIPPPDFLKSFVGERPAARRIGRLAKVIGIGLFVVLLVLAWRFTPLAELTRPALIAESLEAVAEMPAAPLIVLAIFVIAGLIVFPITLLIAATAAAFGPVLGFIYAAVGALISATVTYFAGRIIGRDALENVMGPRLNRIRRSITRRGLIAVATVRMVPIAPFTLVNLVAGASRIPVTDYIIGTVLGMLPGLVLMSALGYQIISILTQPTLLNVTLFVLAVMAWIGASLGAQALVLRYRRPKG